MSPSLGYVILAAGKGTRMHSDQPKVLQTILGKPLLGYVYDALSVVDASRVWTVVGHKADAVQAKFSDRKDQFIIQREQLGTGHALSIAWPEFSSLEMQYVCVLNGDTPYVPITAITRLTRACAEHSAAMGFLTITIEDPRGYGRVLRAESGAVHDIVEEKDFDQARHGEIHEVNAGIYLFNIEKCGPLLERIDQNNAQREFYITQLLPLCVQAGHPVIGMGYDRPTNLHGINSPRELVAREEMMREEIVSAWIEAGVIIRNHSSVAIGADAVLEPGAQITGPCEIYGRSRIGRGTCVDSHCWIKDAELRACQVKSFSHIDGAVVLDDAVVGPFARLRPGTVIGSTARVGNFVEVKKSVLHEGAKAGHLAYLGDCDVGSGVNIGAGTITCNYDGAQKHRTEIKEYAFIGSNSALVAPVVVGAHALVGAGSVVTKDVPDGAMCIARARQTNLDRRKRVTTSDD